VDIEGAAEEVGKAEDVVDLVGIVAAPGRHDGIGAHGMGLFRRDLGIGVRHGEDHRVVGHAGDHVRGDRALRRDAEEHVGAPHRVIERARFGAGGMGRFPLVHALGAALVDHALGIAHDAVVMARAHGFQQFQAGDARRPGAVEDDLHVLDLLAGDLQRVDEARGADHRGAVLVVMEHRDVHDLLQPLFDDEALGGLDVLKVDAAEGGAH